MKDAVKTASMEKEKPVKPKQRPMYCLIKPARPKTAPVKHTKPVANKIPTVAVPTNKIDESHVKAAQVILKWYRKFQSTRSVKSPKLTDRMFESTAAITTEQQQQEITAAMREDQASKPQENKTSPDSTAREPESTVSKIVGADKASKTDHVAEITQACDSKQRVQRIMQYLKSVDTETQSQMSFNTQNSSPSASPQQQQQTSPTPNFLNDTAFTRLPDIRKNMLGLQLELKEHEKTIHVLRSEVKRLKEGAEEDKSQLQKEMKSKLTLQRKEYESIVKRHLGMIDKILLEKEDLAKQCNTMTEEYKALEKKMKDKIMLMEENHTRDLKQKRDLWEATEKVKRDRWIQEKTKLIKDQTVKGLEPEIQRMVAQHKHQMKRMEEKYREDMIREREILMEQQRQEIETYRDRIAIERRKAAEEERENARQKYEKNAERDELEFQQQRRKMLATFEEQKDRLVASMKDEKRMAEVNWKKMLDDAKQQVEIVKIQKQEAMNEMQKVHQEELARLREKQTADVATAKNQVRALFEQEFRDKEKQLREKLVKDRDHEIEMVIERLEQETYSNSSDLTRKHRQEFDRLKREHEKEIQQLKDASEMALDKVLTLQEKLRTYEETQKEQQKEIMRYQYDCAAKEKIIKQQEMDIKRYQLSEEDLKQMIRKEMELELTARENELKIVRFQIQQHNDQLAMVRDEHQREQTLLKQNHERELQMVEQHIKQTLRLKDDTINELRTKLEEATIKVAHLEVVIEKQRKEFLA